MTLKSIAWQNLTRRKGKAAFILAGLLIGVSTVVAIITFIDAMTLDINKKLEKYGANILVVPRSENLSLTYGGLALGGISFEIEEIREADLTKIRSIKNARNIAAVGPMVLGVIHLFENKVLLAGVDFDVSAILKPWWRVQGEFPDDNSVVLGSEAARILNLAPGDRIRLKGTPVKVAGILSPTGSQDDQIVFSRLATAQKILGKTGKLSMVEVAALCDACPIEEMVRQIGAALPAAKVMAIQQVVKGRMQTLSQFQKFSYGISGVILLIGSLVVLVTLMGSVRERTGEIGIFRAVGFRRRYIMEIVFLETATLSCLAGILGYILGYGAARAALGLLIEGRTISIPFNLELAVGALVIALVVGIISGTYPAVMASKLDPNDALRAL